MIYTACIEPDDLVSHFGQGETPELAINDFLINGEFDEYCYCREISGEQDLKVEVYETLYKSDWDEEQASIADSEGYEWILGKHVRTQEVKSK